MGVVGDNEVVESLAGCSAQAGWERGSGSVLSRELTRSGRMLQLEGEDRP